LIFEIKQSKIKKMQLRKWLGKSLAISGKANRKSQSKTSIEKKIISKNQMITIKCSKYRFLKKFNRKRNRITRSILTIPEVPEQKITFIARPHKRRRTPWIFPSFQYDDFGSQKPATSPGRGARYGTRHRSW
jgi:hypothetical protein